MAPPFVRVPDSMSRAAPNSAMWLSGGESDSRTPRLQQIDPPDTRVATAGTYTQVFGITWQCAPKTFPPEHAIGAGNEWQRAARERAVRVPDSPARVRRGRIRPDTRPGYARTRAGRDRLCPAACGAR